MARSSQRVGWYLLQKGRGPIMHGAIPEGAVECPAPSAAPVDQLVDAGDSVTQVDPLALGDEQGAQLEQLADGEAGIVDALDEDPDVFGHED